MLIVSIEHMFEDSAIDWITNSRLLLFYVRKMVSRANDHSKIVTVPSDTNRHDHMCSTYKSSLTTSSDSYQFRMLTVHWALFILWTIPQVGVLFSACYLLDPPWHNLKNTIPRCLGTAAQQGDLAMVLHWCVNKNRATRLPASAVVWPETPEGDKRPSCHHINTYHILTGTEKRNE